MAEAQTTDDLIEALLHDDETLSGLAIGVYLYEIPADVTDPFPCVVIQPAGEPEDVSTVTGYRAFVYLDYRVFAVGDSNGSVHRLTPIAKRVDELLGEWRQLFPGFGYVIGERRANLRQPDAGPAFSDFPTLGGTYRLTVCPDS